MSRARRVDRACARAAADAPRDRGDLRGITCGIRHGDVRARRRPTSTEMAAPDARRSRTRGHPWIVAERAAARWSATPMRARIVRGPLTATPSRIRSTSLPSAVGQGIGRAAARRADRRLHAPRRPADDRGDRRRGQRGVDRAARRRRASSTSGRCANVGRKFDRWIDVVLMQRALGEGARLAAGGAWHERRPGTAADHPFVTGLARNAANYVPLTPVVVPRAQRARSGRDADRGPPRPRWRYT